LWKSSVGEATAPVDDYLGMVREFDHRWHNLVEVPRFYPGSPWIARLLARPIDRLALCEKHPAECAALRAEFGGLPRISVHEMDGYVALRAMLPPPERRALVLIDPPFESQDEFAQIAVALGGGLRRFPRGVFAVWYPLTTRARVDEFFAAIRSLNPPPALAVELTVAGERSELKMKGCGLLVINPPWHFERMASTAVMHLAQVLAQAPGGGARVEWVVRERDGE
jgi:23S rRNA (adenine2030-N6)-methyltransferase